MTKLKVLIPTIGEQTSLPSTLPEFIQFQKEFDVHIVEYSTADQLKTDLKTKFNDISAWYETAATFRLGGFNQFIEYFPESLKIVAFPWVGANAFDHEALRKKGIDLVNVGDVPAKDVADIALSLTLSTFRFTSYFERALREEEGDITLARKAIGSTKIDDKGKPIPPEGPINWFTSQYVVGNTLNSPHGKTAGIVGLGAIGKEIARRLDAIGLKIKYTKRSPLTQEELSKLSFKPEFYPTFKELIQADVDLIVLAVPHTPETINLINEDTLKLVKKGVRIVNIGRGSAIDEDALFKALDDGTVNSIGLDVFVNEPHIDKRFLNKPNISILPHLGSFTEDNFRENALIIIQYIKEKLVQGTTPKSVLN